jgi:hypothetical protein
MMDEFKKCMHTEISKRYDSFLFFITAEQGEEISISYLDPILSPAKRRANLFEKYNFTCSCRRCNGKEINGGFLV